MYGEIFISAVDGVETWLSLSSGAVVTEHTNFNTITQNIIRFIIIINLLALELSQLCYEYAKP